MRMQHCVAITQALGRSHKYRLKGVECGRGSSLVSRLSVSVSLRLHQRHFEVAKWQVEDRAAFHVVFTLTWTSLRPTGERVRILKTAINSGQCPASANYPPPSCMPPRCDRLRSDLFILLKFLFSNLSFRLFTCRVHNWKKGS